MFTSQEKKELCISAIDKIAEWMMDFITKNRYDETIFVKIPNASAGIKIVLTADDEHPSSVLLNFFETKKRLNLVTFNDYNADKHRSVDEDIKERGISEYAYALIKNWNDIKTEIKRQLLEITEMEKTLKHFKA